MGKMKFKFMLSLLISTMLAQSSKKEEPAPTRSSKLQTILYKNKSDIDIPTDHSPSSEFKLWRTPDNNFSSFLGFSSSELSVLSFGLLTCSISCLVIYLEFFRKKRRGHKYVKLSKLKHMGDANDKDYQYNNDNMKNNKSVQKIQK